MSDGNRTLSGPDNWCEDCQQYHPVCYIGTPGPRVLDPPCPAIDQPHVCCNGPRDCGGMAKPEDWCHHCAPGALDDEGNLIDFGLDCLP